MAIVLACGHSKASPTAPAPARTDQPTNATDQPTNAGQPAADERQIHPVEARAVLTTHDHGKLMFAIGIPRAIGPGVVQNDWIGMFTADGKEIPGSKFKLSVVRGWMVTAEIVADALPSETVRLFPPGYRGRF
ncbi:MAG TPA: hypothetical protein VFP84_02455 [Kofleriaceae bacterium]|nr:hypothetical protein [Kofleriaceae bacterium]